METGESSLSRKEETGYSEFFFLVDEKIEDAHNDTSACVCVCVCV